MRPDHFQFFFSALGVFNGLLLAGYLLLVQTRRQRNDYLLAGLIGMFVLRVGVSCGYYFEGRIPWSVVQLGMMANVMLGPFLLAYLSTALPAPLWFSSFLKWLLVGQLSLLIVLGAFYPFADNAMVWDRQLRYIFHAVLAVYLLAGVIITYRYVNPSNGEHRQARTVTAITILVCLGFALSLYVEYSLGPILASVFFYLGLFWWWWEGSRTLSTPINSATYSADFQSFTDYLISERRFARADLKAKDVAKGLGISSAKLTKIISLQPLSFSKYVARLRVAEAKHLLRERPELTIEAIGYEAGFSSRSTFFAVFKAYTGKTPGAFQRELNL